MEINLSSTLPSLTVQALSRTTPVKLEIGQMQSAVVLERLTNGRLNLLIQGTKVPAQTPMPLPPGTQLNLRVERLSPQVILKIVPGASNAAQIRNTALLNALPRQIPLAEVLNNVVANGLAVTLKTPVALKTTAQVLLDNIPRLENLTQAKAVRDILQRSGTFLEPRMARAIALSNPPRLGSTQT